MERARPELAALPEHWPALLTLVRQRAGVDFRDHRRDVLVRGLARRLDALGGIPLEDYLRRLEGEPDEIDHLVESLVLRVSSFFREREVFEALAAVVLPQQRLRALCTPLRVWAAGVASGEEAWSLAMLLGESSEQASHMPVSLLATDVDGHALTVARAGRYPARAATDVPGRLRSRYLRKEGEEGEHVVVAPELRPIVTFARHDLMGATLAPAEAVLASFHLLVVRNVLLYFDARLRQKTLERLSAVIKPGGALVLGACESIDGCDPSLARRFQPYPGVPEHLRIFQTPGE